MHHRTTPHELHNPRPPDERRAPIGHGLAVQGTSSANEDV